MKLRLLIALVGLLTLFPGGTHGQQRDPGEKALQSEAIDWGAVGQEAAGWLSRYIQVNTTNPPGNEIAAARFLRDILLREGIEFLILEQADGKAALVGRVRATAQPQKGAVILLNHMDVVAASPEHWSVDPFTGLIRDGYVWGRGALDMKGTAIAELMALVLIHRQGAELTRDIIFLATSDEEIVGGTDAGVFVREHHDLIDGADYLLNEGGTIRVDELEEGGALRYYGVGVTEKSPYWQRVTARGVAGHGSQPIDSSSVHRLVRALERIRSWETEVKLTPPVAEFFSRLAETLPPEEATVYRDIEGSLAKPETRRQILGDRYFNSVLRNTISITRISGSPKTNVIPPVASAELDVRLLPGEDPDAFLADLRRRAGAGGDSITIEPLADTWEATSSPTDSELFQAIESTVAELEPGATVLPYVLSGFTDSHYFREIGVESYGIGLFKLPNSESARVHGNDERLSLSNLESGIRFLYSILVKVGT